MNPDDRFLEIFGQEFGHSSAYRLLQLFKDLVRVEKERQGILKEMTALCSPRLKNPERFVGVISDIVINQTTEANNSVS